jgi:hypothetical protein
MPIIYQKFIRRQDLRNNRDKFYVFGDNMQRIGYGGQARDMRGEPNAIGAVTKPARFTAARQDPEAPALGNPNRTAVLLTNPGPALKPHIHTL